MSLIALFEKYFKEYLNEEDSIINQTNAKLLQSNLIMNSQIENGQKISKKRDKKAKEIADIDGLTLHITDKDVAKRAKIRLTEWIKL